MNQNPESLEGRREILYRDYSEVYEEFAQGTYRFIHSKSVIDYIRKHRKMVIRWKWRVHDRRVP